MDERTFKAPRWNLWLGLILVAISAGLGFQRHWSEDVGFVDPTKVQEFATIKVEPRATEAANDWPQWRGPHRDGTTDQVLADSWPAEGPKVLWTYPVGKSYSAPAIAAGKLYVFFRDEQHEVLACLDAETGKDLWRFAYANPYSVDYGNWPRSTPAVDGDRIYIVGGNGVMHCLTTAPADAKGEMVWRKELLADFNAPILKWGIACSPLIDGDRVYVQPGGPSGNSIVALNKTTGAVLWHALDDAGSYSSPMLGTLAGQRQLVVLTASGLAGLSAEAGQLLWRFPWVTSFDVNTVTPILYGDYVFISSGYSRGCALVKVEKTNEGFQASRVYEHIKMSNHFSTCVRVDDHLFGFHDTVLTCMNFRTGRIAWKERGFDKGSLIAVGNDLIILGEKGNVARAEATPEKYQEKARFQFSHDTCWVMPVLAQGRLYLRDSSRLACYDLRK